MKAAQRAVAFVAFGNEIFTALVPIRVRSENRNFSAHIVPTDAVRLREAHVPSLRKWLFCRAFRRSQCRAWPA